jgi:hypothetical protein
VTLTRVQRERSKNWRMPEGTINVSRPSEWGNPFVAHGDGHGASNAVANFRCMLQREGAWLPVPLPWSKGEIPAQMTTVDDVPRELKGKDIAYWCALDKPCHADVLLEIANSEEGKIGSQVYRSLKISPVPCKENSVLTRIYCGGKSE